MTALRLLQDALDALIPLGRDDSACDARGYIIAARRELESARAAQVEPAPAPAGFVLVPVEPTEDMELAGMRALRNTYRTVSGEYSREQARACFDAMLAAAAQEQTHEL